MRTVLALSCRIAPLLIVVLVLTASPIVRAESFMTSAVNFTSCMPEPSTLAFVAMGLAGGVLRRRR